MLIKDIKLVNFDKYLQALNKSDPRDDLKINTKLTMILNHVAMCCKIEGLTVLEYTFLKEMASTAVLDKICLQNVANDNTDFSKKVKDLYELSHTISTDEDCISTDFGILPLFASNCSGYFRFSGSSLLNITGGMLTRHVRLHLDNKDELIATLKNDLLVAFCDNIRNYYNDVDLVSESIAHYKFYSSKSDVTLIDIKTSNGILNFFNATDSDKVLGVQSIKELTSSDVQKVMVAKDMILSFAVQGPISTFGLFGIYTDYVNLGDTDSLRLAMNGRDLVYIGEHFKKYGHRIEDATVAYLNERDNCIKDKKFTIEDILATIPSNSSVKYMVNISMEDAWNLIYLLQDLNITEKNCSQLGYLQFYDICKKIKEKADLISDKFLTY